LYSFTGDSQQGISYSPQQVVISGIYDVLDRLRVGYFIEIAERDTVEKCLEAGPSQALIET
jgi:hypothetical protein